MLWVPPAFSFFTGITVSYPVSFVLVFIAQALITLKWKITELSIFPWCAILGGMSLASVFLSQVIWYIVFGGIYGFNRVELNVSETKFMDKF